MLLQNVLSYLYFTTDAGLSLLFHPNKDPLLEELEGFFSAKIWIFRFRAQAFHIYLRFINQIEHLCLPAPRPACHTGNKSSLPFFSLSSTEPHFLHAIEYGNYVYFFFSEIAVEYTTLGKVRYSFQSRHSTNLCCVLFKLVVVSARSQHAEHIRDCCSVFCVGCV